MRALQLHMDTRRLSQVRLCLRQARSVELVYLVQCEISPCHLGGAMRWNRKTCSVRSLQPMVLDGFWPHGWSFSPNGEILAAVGMRHPAPKEATDRYEIRLWGLADSKVVAKLPTPEPYRMPLTFGANGRQLAQVTVGPPPQIRFFQWATNEPSSVVPVPLPLWTFDWAFAPDGKLLAAH